MSILGFSQIEQTDMFGLICGILHSSNLSFVSVGEEESSLDLENNSFAAVLSLFGFNEKSLNDAVCAREVTVGKETFIKLNTIDKSQKALEAIMKALYHALFTYVVGKINETMSLKKILSKESMEKAGFIEVLDIFGFESFMINSFEQLCINYCNEVLQQQFNLTVFMNDLREFKEEGEYRFRQSLKSILFSS